MTKTGIVILSVCIVLLGALGAALFKIRKMKKMETALLFALEMTRSQLEVAVRFMPDKPGAKGRKKIQRFLGKNGEKKT